MANEGPGREGHVATLLRQAREASGLTQRALSDEMGIARTTIIKAEEGGTLPTPDILARLGGPLGIPVLMVCTAHLRDALRNNQPALRQFEEELAENNAYGKASADLLGLSVEKAYFTVRITADGALSLEQRLTKSSATRELRSLSFWLSTPATPGDVSASFAIEDAPVHMGWRQESQADGNERLNRIFFDEPWKPDGSKLTFINSFMAKGVYKTSRDEFERGRSPLLSPEKWPGKFFIHVKHAIQMMHLQVILPATTRPIFGPPYAHWDKRPLDVTAAHEIEEGRVCKSFTTETAETAFSLQVERPAPAFSFGVQWTLDEDEEQS